MVRSYWLQYDEAHTEVEMIANHDEEEDLLSSRFKTEETYISLETTLKARIKTLSSSQHCTSDEKTKVLQSPLVFKFSYF